MTCRTLTPRQTLLRSIAVLALSAMGAGTSLADTRSVETAYGPVTVNGQPERVVTLYEGALDTTLAVDANPVGAVITRGGSDVADYIKSRAGNIAIVGAPAETNIEAVISVRPDLILAAPRTNKQQYQLLSRIAPVIVSDVPMFQPDSWERETRLFAKALGKEEAAEQVIAKVESRIGEVAALVAARIPEAQRDATLVRWMPQGPLVMAEGLFSASILQAVGFRIDDNDLVKEGRPHSEPLSLENLSSMDQSWVFLATLNEDGDKALEAARQSPAFARLDAVEHDRVITVSGQLWTSATGPLAVLAILDDIEAAVTAIQP
ncbi:MULTISPECIES: iron-siderophore ABC transporter substrate-binding protein [Marinobacter]|uniref:ABC transporter substrate-binding protein n=1 Tax=Marinobacter TaxID=2742 RepID=UPI001C98BADE|nr:iron-siderophore ABC transporter substrate-binding protein [Marinobacter nauticus]MBY5960751.1 iron-siderophore ABC transporter substrate-binding protein [Marinobacter nauticus]MBY6104142.1 iron-siderophore ABC transporter substrate-binding protein [Marinobacter nauticus]MBY6192326.1 iron-siderophore ABC transporter substrate-binding protein [Marinobacter nauticus]MBY6213474.1 iron-siderophore ABC transporter substrate-binding protein [Marinobacter nauticus]